MDEEIELTTVDGQTARVALSGAVAAVGRAVQHDAYSVPGRDGERIEVRRVREEPAYKPPSREEMAARAERRRLLLAQFDAENPDLVGKRCRCSSDGEVCNWDRCPQIRDGEPDKSGRHCPLDRYDDEEE